jgi:Tfp pilus assembly protein PilX
MSKTKKERRHSAKDNVNCLKYNKSRGSILVITIVVSAVLIILSGTVLNMAINEDRHTRRLVGSTSALNLAEAGVEYAIWEMNYNGGSFSTDDGWSGTSTKTKTTTFETDAGDVVGEYAVNVTNPGSSTVVVETTAYVPSQDAPIAERTVRVELENPSPALFSMAAYGINSLTMGDSAKTDSFDSTVAAYNPSSPGTNGDVGTSSIAASAITLGTSVYINGDGYVGVSGDPSVVMPYNSSYYSGTKQAQETAYAPPDVVVPSLTDKGALSLDGTATINTSGKYSSITLEKDSVITINADVELHITSEIYFKKDSRIDITNGANVKIYIDGGLKWNKDGQFNNVGHDPTKLTIYATSNYDDSDPLLEDETAAGIHIKKDTIFYGAIYAPNVSVEVKKDSQIYGAIIGKNVSIAQNTQIHFDEALLDAGGGSGVYSVSYWQEK